MYLLCHINYSNQHIALSRHDQCPLVVIGLSYKWSSQSVMVNLKWSQNWFKWSRVLIIALLDSPQVTCGQYDLPIVKQDKKMTISIVIEVWNLEGVCLFLVDNIQGSCCKGKHFHCSCNRKQAPSWIELQMKLDADFIVAYVWS